MALLGLSMLSSACGDSNKIKEYQMMARYQIDNILSEGLEKYKKDMGRYPTTNEGLNSLLTNPGLKEWKGPYLRKNLIPKDPWLTPYQYQSPGVHGPYDLYSYGADKALGGEGWRKDITNLDK